MKVKTEPVVVRCNNSGPQSRSNHRRVSRGALSTSQHASASGGARASPSHQSLPPPPPPPPMKRRTIHHLITQLEGQILHHSGYVPLRGVQMALFAQYNHNSKNRGGTLLPLCGGGIIADHHATSSNKKRRLFWKSRKSTNTTTGQRQNNKTNNQKTTGSMKDSTVTVRLLDESEW